MQVKVNINGIDTEITLTQEQIDAATFVDEKIELSGGHHYISSAGVVKLDPSFTLTSNFGMEATTEKVAEKMAKDMRLANRIRARAYEIDPDYVDEFDYTKHNKQPVDLSYFIYNNSGEWKTHSNINGRYGGVVTMLYSTAMQLCEEINSGRFDPFGN